MVLGIIFVCILIIVIPVFGTWNMYNIIDDTKFKRIKIRKMKWLFRAIGFQSVEEHGIIISLYILQLLSYPISLCSLIIGIAMLVREHDPKSALLFPSIALGIEVAVWIITILVLSILSKVRNKKLQR